MPESSILAAPSLTNDAGRTPADFARYDGQVEVADRLQGA